MSSFIAQYKEKYKECYWVDFHQLEAYMIDVLKGVGVPDKDARIVGDVLIESDRRGIDSHGIGRLKPIYIDRIDAGVQNPLTQIDLLKETETTAVLDGNNGMGHVVSHRATEIAIEKAQTHGMAMVAVRHSTHYGIAGYYATMAAEKGMIGITGTNARPSIAPTFGVENMLGTNPLTIGIPTDEDFPFVLDCATSVSQRGKIEVYGRAGKDLPEGWVIGQDGTPRTDTLRILEDLKTGAAALAPLGGIGDTTGGYKGYGYATVVEILSAALQDGKFLKGLNGFDGKGTPMPILLGHFFIVINPDFFMGTALFKAIAGTILRQLRASKKAPGQDQIFTAGEQEHLAWQYRKEHGCPIPVPLQKQITELCERFSLDYAWPWR